MDQLRIVEAVLFSSPRPVKISEIEVQAQMTAAAVRSALRKLQEEYDSRGSALRVAKTGDGWSFVVRDEYSPFGRQFSPREVPQDVLRTATMIAYHQPVLQSDLARTRGPRVYDDVRELKALGLVTSKPKGQTLELSTTRRFSEKFGIEGSSKAAIRKWMEKQSLGGGEGPGEGAPGSSR